MRQVRVPLPRRGPDTRGGQAFYAGLYGEDHAGATIALGNYADTLRELGRVDEALPLQRRAPRQMEQVFGRDSPRVAGRVTSLARIHVALGQAAQALPYFDRSIAIYRAHATPGEYRAAVVSAHRSQGLLAPGREGEAMRSSRTALEDITAAVGPEHRYRWEALALHAQAACRAGHAECSALGQQVQKEAGHARIPGGARMKLEQTLASIAR